MRMDCFQPGLLTQWAYGQARPPSMRPEEPWLGGSEQALGFLGLGVGGIDPVEQCRDPVSEVDAGDGSRDQRGDAHYLQTR